MDKKGANLGSDKKKKQSGENGNAAGEKINNGDYLQAKLPTTLTFSLPCTQSIVPFE